MTDGREAGERTGTLLSSGWARMIVELHVNGLEASLSFWRDVLGFRITYDRPAERFVYLAHPQGHQIMLCQRHGRFETGPLNYPLGQGAMFQIYLEDLEPVLAALKACNWPVYLGPREVWRQTGDCESGQREVFVQDPDGYLPMIATNIGRRSPSEAIPEERGHDVAAALKAGDRLRAVRDELAEGGAAFTQEEIRALRDNGRRAARDL